MNPQDPNAPMTPEQPPQSNEPVTQPTLSPAENVAPAPEAQPVPVTMSQPMPNQPLAQPVPPSTAMPGATDEGHTLAIVALITTLLGLSLVGLITGIISSKKSKKSGHKTSPMALIAIILSVINMVIFVPLFIFLTLANFQGAQATARDTETVSDINNLYAKLEEFYNENLYYPDTIEASLFPGISEDALVASNGSAVVVTKSSASSSSLAIDEVDVSKGEPYQYIGVGCSAGKCKSYVLAAYIENESTVFPNPYIKSALSEL